MAAFPAQLAKIVCDRWSSLVAGEYVAPPCPPLPVLRRLLEEAYIASAAPEESRFPQFNLIAVPPGLLKTSTTQKIWSFGTSRPFNADELRRLAPAADLRKSAVLVTWTDKSLEIAGLVDLGTSWYRARSGLSYQYQPPETLFIQVDRPGRIRVYQGAYLMATLTDGKLESSFGIQLNTFLHAPVHAGLKRIGGKIEWPDYEPNRESSEFAFMAYWNTFAAIANAISQAGHGGMLVISSGDRPIDKALVKLKYDAQSSVLQDCFVAFLNARNLVGDCLALDEDLHLIPRDVVHEAEISVRDTLENLVEATRFVATLSGCDGSIVLSDHLELQGFGGEILAELPTGTNVYESKSEADRKHQRCDIEQFGMRHRSAIKLVGKDRECTILVVSQDGPISAVWWSDGAVFVRKGIRLPNMNMPWA